MEQWENAFFGWCGDLITTPPHSISDVHEPSPVTATFLCSHVLAFEHSVVLSLLTSNSRVRAHSLIAFLHGGM